jgi:hypothetical protein
MNQPDPMYSTNPECVGPRLAEPPTPGMVDGYADNLPGSQALEYPVIARIPALDPPTTSRRHKRSHSSEAKTTKSATETRYGRLISASLSMKILAGMGIFLFVGAIGHHIYLKVSDKSPADDGQAMEQAWQPPLPAPTANLAPAWEPPSAQTASFPEIEPAIADMPTEKTEPNRTAIARNSTWSGDVKAQADGPKGDSPIFVDTRIKTVPDFSPWPNPAHPVLAKDDVRQDESYTADRRNTPPTDSPMQTHSDRINYDLTRPSIH